MKRISTSHTEQLINISKNVSFVSSWIEFEDETPDINIGYEVKFSSAQISVYSGGTLIINDLCEISGRIIVGPNCQVTIGYGLICNDLIFIHAADNTSITIGDDCLFANVRIYSSDMHSIFLEDSGERINQSQNVIINNKVWLSRDVLVLKGVEVGMNSLVGARSLLTDKYPAFSIIAGSPGKVVKTGISWSRSLVQDKSKILTHDFPTSRFRTSAVQFDNDEVIALAIHLWELRDLISNEDHYILYYLARSILLREFKGKNISYVVINNKIITLRDIYDTFLLAFEKSEFKNKSCKDYAILTNDMLEHINKVRKIYNNDNYRDIRNKHADEKLISPTI